MKKRYWFLIALIALGVVTLRGRVIRAVWEFHDGFMGIPRRR